jgi:hypothetical protein
MNKLIQILRGLRTQVVCATRIHSLLVVNPAVTHWGLRFDGLL